jgi:NADH dehydrogenase FAD-containing subunit
MQLHTIIVGAGPSGVELAGALRPYLVRLAKKSRIDPTLVTVDLLDSSPRVLAAIPPEASALVAKQLEKNGVKIYTNYGVNACEENCLKVTDKSGSTEMEKELHAGTVIWTAGTKISATFATIPGITMTDRKRIVVTPTLTLPTDDHIYIAGDGAGTQFSGLAQTAIDHGKYVGSAIVQRIAGHSIAPYEPKQGVFVIPVGKRWAILNYKELVLSGFAPWVMRVLVDANYFFSIASISTVLNMLKKK